jgi:hypothetical protein
MTTGTGREPGRNRCGDNDDKEEEQTMMTGSRRQREEDEKKGSKDEGQQWQGQDEQGDNNGMDKDQNEGNCQQSRRATTTKERPNAQDVPHPTAACHCSQGGLQVVDDEQGSNNEEDDSPTIHPCHCK